MARVSARPGQRRVLVHVSDENGNQLCVPIPNEGLSTNDHLDKGVDFVACMQCWLSHPTTRAMYMLAFESPPGASEA